MNREVMGRQMFAKGGAAFPDLSGDGNVTQKDILMGRGVIPMQQGGMAPMPAPAAPGPQMMPPGLPAIDPNSVDINEAAQGAMQQGINPAELEGMLTQYAGQMQDLENAEDYETVINGIRGNTAPIEQRYEELSQIVGPEDSQQTPESVLTLLQPVMQIAAVDQGIGGLAAEEMSAPVEGAMAEGIMSTVNMGAPEAPTQVPGGPAPVNFNQGGAVQYMNVGGAADPALQRQQTLFDQQRTLYGQLIDPAQQEEDLEEQRKLTQAQMLFDVAQGALMFASPGEKNMSPAEKLAQSFTPVLGNIGERAGAFGKFKQAQKAEGRQLDQMAFQTASQLYGAERSSELARDDKPISDTFKVTIKGEDGKITETERPLTTGQYNDLVTKFGMGNVTVSKIFKPTSASKAQNFILNGDMVSFVPGTPGYNLAVASGAVVASPVDAGSILDRKQYTLTQDITIGEKVYPAGSSPFFTDVELAGLTSQFGADVIQEYQAPRSARDFFMKYGMDEPEFNKLDETTRQYMQGLPILTNVDYFKKFGMSKQDFMLLSPLEKQRMLGLEPEYRFDKVDNGKTIDIIRTNIHDPEAKGVSIFSDDIVGKPNLFRVTMMNDDGTMTPSVVDISTPEGKKTLALVNEMNSQQAGSAIMQKIGTESNQVSAYLIAGAEPGGGAALRMSFDGGQTYIGDDGKPRLLPTTGVVPIGDTVAYEAYKREKVRADARKFLSANDTALEAGINADGSGFEAITTQDKKLVKDVLAEVRAGTGTWSSIFAGVNAVVGGTIAPETFSELFKETEEGRQFTKLVYVLGRSALASSPRFAVTDLEVTGQLFPNPDTFFANPISEANKIVSLVEALNQEEIRLQQMRASDSPVDAQVLATAEQKLGEIARLKQLLGPVAQMAGTASVTDLSGAQNLLKKKGMNLSGSGSN